LDLFKMIEELRNNIRNMKRDYVQALLLFCFLFPLFFQLSGSIFTSKDFNFESEGSLFLIPLPIASIFCFIGIAILLRLEKKHFGMGFVFSMFVLMMLSTIVSTGGAHNAELAKFILLIQFILPMFALVFGSLYLTPKSDYLRFEAVALYVLLLIIPLEVISTIIRGSGLLSPYLHVFSLYQHLQYLPVIFVGLYFLTVNSLYKNNKLRFLIIFLAPWMGIYLTASMSILTTMLAVMATVISCWMLNKERKTSYIILVMLLLWISYAIYYPTVKATDAYALKYSQTLQPEDFAVDSRLKNSQLLELKQQQKIYTKITETLPKNKFIALLPNNLKERFYYWGFYGKGIFDDPKIFLFGHENRPDRNAYPSAHNYYLDLIYNFGVISVLPFIYLIFLTIRSCWQVTKSGLLTPGLAILITVVGFFIFADNFLKVSFRQPYPGMVIFFLWGVLLTKVSISDENLSTDT